MRPTKHYKKRPWWIWILLFIAAVFLSILGYGLMITGNEMANNWGHPSLTVVGVALVLGLYALFVRLIEGHWPTDQNLRRLIPHTLLGLLIGVIFMFLVVGAIVASGYATITWKGFSGEQQFDVLMMFFVVAAGEEMVISMPSETGYTQLATSPLAPFTSTRHTRQDP